jgi:hypothetical protein
VPIFIQPGSKHAGAILSSVFGLQKYAAYPTQSEA